MKNVEDRSKEESGVLFSETEGLRTDGHLHDEMLESVSSVANEAGIRILMQNGLTREMALKLICPSKSGSE